MSTLSIDINWWHVVQVIGGIGAIWIIAYFAARRLCRAHAHLNSYLQVASRVAALGMPDREDEPEAWATVNNELDGHREAAIMALHGGIFDIAFIAILVLVVAL